MSNQHTKAPKCSCDHYVLQIFTNLRADLHLNCTGMRSAFLCTSVWCDFQPIRSNGLKLHKKIFKNALHQMACCCGTMRSGTDKCTALWGIVRNILTPAVDHTSSVLWTRGGKCGQNTGFSHCVLVWTSPKAELQADIKKKSLKYKGSLPPTHI